MKILLDTHTILWFVEDVGRMSEAVKVMIENEENEKFVSLASAWEIAIKVGLGKLSLNTSIEVFFADLLRRNGFSLLPISLPQALSVRSLPLHHRDPFDRLLIAQSLMEGMPIVSADLALDAYGVSRLWQS